MAPSEVLPDGTGSPKTKMAAEETRLNVYQLLYTLAMEFRCHHAYEQRYELFSNYFRSIAAIFDFQHTQTSKGFRTGPTVLPDPENVEVAVEITLLSHIPSEIYGIAYLLSVNGGQL